MFFHIQLEKKLQMHPRNFGPQLRTKIVEKLVSEVEGTCMGQHGYIVAVTTVDTVGTGMIRDGTGFVIFPVKYQCIVFRPFKGEILEAAVTLVTKHGFMVEAGPVQIFVSNPNMPDDMKFVAGDVNSFQTEDGMVTIQKETEVRLRIMGIRVEATEIFCIGSIKEDYLGLTAEGGPPI